MAITFQTQNPSNLLAAFKQAIAEGHVVTWMCDSDGDFTHNTDQWRHMAYLRPSVQNGQLVFTIWGNSKVVTTWTIYGIYQGRFIESMITHCHDRFSNAAATAAPTSADRPTAKAA